MDTQIKIIPENIPQQKVQAIKVLYDKYAGMLLGYICTVVEDKQLAEQYLAETFSSILLQDSDFLTLNGNQYCKLQGLCRKILSQHFSGQDNGANSALSNPVINQLTEMQQTVFCSLYYYGKTTANVAAMLNISQAEVRKILKEAFSIVRNNS